VRRGGRRDARAPATGGVRRLSGGVRRHTRPRQRHKAPGGGLRPGRLAGRAARVRPARRRHGAGLARRAVAAAGGGHRGCRIPRRDRRADPGQGALSWYPPDVWRYVLSCQWSRIAEEEAFGGRCAEAGDELGSVVVTARLARDLMRLWLLMHRRYPPYSKWLGSAFAQAPGGGRLGRHLADALAAAGWAAREREFAQA